RVNRKQANCTSSSPAPRRRNQRSALTLPTNSRAGTPPFQGRGWGRGPSRPLRREVGILDLLLRDELEQSGTAFARLGHAALDGGDDLARLGHALAVAAQGA